MGICLDQAENMTDCGSPDCTYGDCSAESVAQTGGVAANTVAPNPSISAAGGSANSITQLSATLGQWGATIAGIVTGQPTVSGPQGVRTGYAAVTPSQMAAGSPAMLILVGIVVLGVILIVARK